MRLIGERVRGAVARGAVHMSARSTRATARSRTSCDPSGCIATKYLDSYLRWFHLIELADRPPPRACLTAAMAKPCLRFARLSHIECRLTPWRGDEVVLFLSGISVVNALGDDGSAARAGPLRHRAHRVLRHRRSACDPGLNIGDVVIARSLGAVSVRCSSPAEVDGGLRPRCPSSRIPTRTLEHDVSALGLDRCSAPVPRRSGDPLLVPGGRGAAQPAPAAQQTM